MLKYNRYFLWLYLALFFVVEAVGGGYSASRCDFSMY